MVDSSILYKTPLFTVSDLSQKHKKNNYEVSFLFSLKSGKLSLPISLLVRTKNKTLDFFETLHFSFCSVFQNQIYHYRKIIPNLFEKLPSFLQEKSLVFRINNFKKNILTDFLKNWFNHFMISSLKSTDVLGAASIIEFFPVARSMKRHFILNVGPTNSGKTHSALDALSSASSGVYLAPLRLMAFEGTEKLAERSVLSNLVTGEELQIYPSSSHTSSTIEMLSLNSPVDVAVIDEVQLLTDKDRGWAWTQAVLGVPAKTIFVAGSHDSIDYMKHMCEMTGDTLEVRYFQRKTPLVFKGSIQGLSSLKKGDAVIAFSRSSVIYLRELLLSRGFSVACIYGALGPDVRKREASRFSSGEADILVATDAVGMGLNLPIQRIVFSETTKFDGVERRDLTYSEIRQVAGRAGRYGFSEEGEVVCFPKCDPDLIQNALKANASSDPDFKPYFMPPLEIIERLGEAHKTKNIYSILEFLENIFSHQEDFSVVNFSPMKFLAKKLSSCKMSLDLAYKYITSPVDITDEQMLYYFTSWVKAHTTGNVVKDCFSIQKSTPLFQLEKLYKYMTLYLWCSVRWPEVYCDSVSVRRKSEQLSELIAKILSEESNRFKDVLLEDGRSIPVSSFFE